MSIAYPPAIDECDGVEEDDNDNRKCHLIGKTGLPLCVRVSSGRIQTHRASLFSDPCDSCGGRRCVECLLLFEPF